MEHIESSVDLRNDVIPSTKSTVDHVPEYSPVMEQDSLNMKMDNADISKKDELHCDNNENVNDSEVYVNIVQAVENSELFRERECVDLNSNTDIFNKDEPSSDNNRDIDDSEVDVNNVVHGIENAELFREQECVNLNIENNTDVFNKVELDSENADIDDSEVNVNDVSCDVNNTEILSDNFHPHMRSHMESLNASVPNESSLNVDKLLSELASASPSCSPASSPPNSPKELFDSGLDINENQTPYRKNFTLPYFQLPNPDLDEFLIETDKNLQIPGTKKSEREIFMPSFEPKDKGDIVFTIEPNAYDKLETKKAHQSLNHPVSLSSECCLDVTKDNEEVSRGSICNEYAKVISSLKELDESKSPGIKRLALKAYLKKKIDEKKFIAFNRAKEFSKLDEEIESDEESTLDNEENLKLGTEFFSSDEDFEEETVSSDKHEEEDCSELDEDNSSNNEKKSELLEHVDDENSCESDDDIEAIKKKRKTKQVQILEEDSSDDSDFHCDVGHSLHADASFLKLESNSKIIQNNENDFNSIEGKMEHDLSIYPALSLNDSDSQISCNKSVLTMCSENLNIDTEHCKNSSLPLEPKNDREGFFPVTHSGLSQISSSIPSYQPCGGFLNQMSQDDSSDSIGSEMKSLNYDNLNTDSHIHFQSLSKFSDFRSSSLFNCGTMEEISENNSLSGPSDTPTFGLSLDDLPVSHTENESDIFSSQDLADVCSGAFKSNTFKKDAKKSFLSKETASEGNGSDLEELPQEKVKDFFDYEAELSGEDDGLDFDDPESDEEGLENGLCVSDHELPTEEELRDEIADLHMKRILDDDAELLKQIKEDFLDDGELNSDGTGRTRRFAWKNNDVDNIGNDKGFSSSESDTEGALDDTWSSINQEKAKWRQENKEEDINEELNSSYKRTFLKVNVIGKPKFSQNAEDSSKRLSFKRPRGSFLHLDDNSASQVLKKLKASEDNSGGSRTTKHFVFRNDLSEDTLATKEFPVNLIPEDPTGASSLSDYGSIFNKI